MIDKEENINLDLIHDIEELSELIQAISHNIRYGIYKDHIIEELADVEVSLDHIKQIYNISDDELTKVKIKKGVHNKYKTGGE